RRPRGRPPRDRAPFTEDRGGRTHSPGLVRSAQRVPLRRVRRAAAARGGPALPPEGTAVPGALSPLLDRRHRRALGPAAPAGRRPPPAADPHPALALQLADAPAGHPVVPGGARGRPLDQPVHAGRGASGRRAAPRRAGGDLEDVTAAAGPHGRAIRPEAPHGMAARARRPPGGPTSLAEIDLARPRLRDD